MADDVVRIAMWSGPRNISTALMRAFEHRADAVVTDEPLYGRYLLATGLDHPGRDEVIGAQETDWRKVAAALVGPIPGGRRIWYQKHMAHHLLPEIGRDWLDQLTNCFLIRDPREVLASYVRTRAHPTLADLGVVQQVEIFEHVRARTGRLPPVLDARDVLEDPRRMLGLLCAAVGIPFSERMLAWPEGARPSDGVWGRHWYAGVWRSTGFRPYRSPTPLPAALEPLAGACEPYYRLLHAHRLGA
ncbi:MAG: HAD family hydrolase [Nitriliruptorales bacterium]